MTDLSKRQKSAVASLSDSLPPPDTQLQLWNEFAGLVPADLVAQFEFWDAIPRFLCGAKTSLRLGRALDPVIREWRYQNVNYQTEIRPVILTQENGERKELLLGEREELVFIAIKKLASEMRNFHREDDSSSVAVSLRLTLSRLRRALAEVGHDMKLIYIREALEVLSSTPIITTNLDTNRRLFARPLISIDYVAAGNDQTGDHTFLKVTFADPIAKAVFGGHYDLIPWERLMTLSGGPLSRWLYVTFFRTLKGGQEGHAYHIQLSRILRESPLTGYKQLRDAHRAVLRAFEALEEDGVTGWFSTADLRDYERHGNSCAFKRVMKRGRGRPAINEVHYAFGLSSDFVKALKRDNAHRRDRTAPKRVLG